MVVLGEEPDSYSSYRARQSLCVLLCLVFAMTGLSGSNFGSMWGLPCRQYSLTTPSSGVQLSRESEKLGPETQK